MAASTDHDSFDALIIGAGFSGMYQLHTLRDKLGLKTLVFETADDVGGTWYWNRYPGARCDSESHAYAYFFSKELHESWEWTERYPGHAEIRRYLGHVVQRLDLKKDIRFGTTVVSAHFNEQENRWTVNASSGETFKTRYLISAVGCLSSANIPDIPGLKDFEGDWYHTGQWPHEDVNLTGKRVGQIGTGSTGIQAVPVIAETAKHLTVFQRTPNFSVPAHNRPLTDEFKEEVKRNYKEIRDLTRSTRNGHPWTIADRKVFDVSDDEREKIYEKSWEIGGLRFRSCFNDLLVDKAANDTSAEFIKNKIRQIVKDPDTAAKLSNIDHPFSTKRPPIDTHYFEAYNRENVSLVDVRTNPIQRITETGVETTEGSHDLDIIVFATGFDAMTGQLLKMDIRGRDGLTIQKAWEAGPRTYLGLTVDGFPNMFVITGPGSPSVLTNMPVAIEQHVEWVTECISHMEKNNIDTIEPTAQAADEWVAHVNDAANATLMPQAGHSWYLGANIPGKPRMFMPYAGGMDRYRDICDEVTADGYRGFAAAKASGPGTKSAAAS